MAQQPDLFPPNPHDPNTADRLPKRTGVPGPEQHISQHIPWMVRVEAIIRILVRLYLGLLVLALPWLPFWTQNNLFTYDSLLLTLASSGFVRGMVSGLGLLNVLMAMLEAKNARELS